MPKRIIVTYGSKYGTTKRYAEWIAAALNADLREAKRVKPEDLEGADVVIHGGGLYAGGIDGVKKVMEGHCRNLIVFTVGLADPEKTDYGAIIERNFTPELARTVKFFHLRGGIDYSKLGPVHKAMMAMMNKSILKKPEAERSEEDLEFLRTYNQTADFMDQRTLQPMIAYVESLS